MIVTLMLSDGRLDLDSDLVPGATTLEHLVSDCPTSDEVQVRLDFTVAQVQAYLAAKTQLPSVLAVADSFP